MTWLLVFFACFIQVGLITLQSINANNRRYVLALFTSWGISCVTVYTVVHVVRDPVTYFVPYFLGNSLGVIMAMRLNEYIVRGET